ncbi:MAG TPA: surface lipoprotein assembly modifier [Micropepsaceae bacterium]|nr:surface lipoprotein assembly modifier [Micropepsaceae bacterium]
MQQQISLEQAAALLLQANRIDEAERVLTLALRQDPNDNEAIFLRGLVEVARQNYDAAIEDFRHILAAEPQRERVRLELARAFFLQGDYENAERNFRFARAGELPDEAKANVDQYLAAIIHLKRWSYNLSLGLADDTNVNGATNLRTVYLYGLPFTLSDNARQTSGAGAAIDVSGEFSPLLSPDSKFLIGGLVHRLQYGRVQFDDMTVSVYSGPQFFLGKWRFDVLATGFGRWYGEAPYAGGTGGRASAGYALLPTLQIGLNVEGQSVWYRPVSDQNGPVYAASTEVAYTVTPSSIVRVSGGVAIQQAQLNAYANDTYWAALDYYQDLPFGFSANLEPAFFSANYRAPLAAFGATRVDHSWAIRLDLLNRRLEYRGFAPRISLIHAHLDSTIALYRYARDQVQFGITRQF